MENSTLFIGLFNFILIAILPKIFFRSDGEFNLKWFVTGSPYFFAPLLLILAKLGVLPKALDYHDFLNFPLDVLGVALFAGSFALMGMTLGTHRVPLALWHQENDAPKSIVTYGAYAKFRHPFYTSFLMSLIATLLIAPGPLTLLNLVWGFVVMNTTAAREEKRLSESEFGSEYQEYMTKTGRFFPKWDGFGG